MPIIKYTKESLDRMTSSRDRLAKKLEKCRKLEGGEKTDFWKTVKELCEEKLKLTEYSLDDYEKLTDTQMIGLLEARRQLRFFINVPKYVTEAIPTLQRQLEDLEKKINDYKSKLDRTGR